MLREVLSCQLKGVGGGCWRGRSEMKEAQVNEKGKVPRKGLTAESWAEPALEIEGLVQIATAPRRTGE
jgi:hypothetical protein